MMIAALLAFLHFVAIFGIAATLVLELVMLTPTPTPDQVWKMQLCDRWYGVFAAVVLLIGVLRIAYFERGWAFYGSSPFFYVKIGLFVLMALISIYPTIRFIQWSKQTRRGRAPIIAAGEYKLILSALRSELLLFLGVALGASLMARAIGR